jgi:hypothetical protein
MPSLCRLECDLLAKMQTQGLVAFLRFPIGQEMLKNSHHEEAGRNNPEAGL